MTDATLADGSLHTGPDEASRIAGLFDPISTVPPDALVAGMQAAAARFGIKTKLPPNRAPGEGDREAIERISALTGLIAQPVPLTDSLGGEGYVPILALSAKDGRHGAALILRRGKKLIRADASTGWRGCGSAWNIDPVLG